MDSYGRVIGRAIGREPAGTMSEFLLVEDKSNAKYPVVVACEFYGQRRQDLDLINPGDFVRVEGALRSNKGTKAGRYFTSFVGLRLINLTVQGVEVPPWAESRPWPPKHTEQRAQEEDNERTDRLPF